MHCILCMLCMLTLLTLVFVAFTQPCILCIQGPPAHPRGKATTFHLVALAVHQSKEATLLTFWICQTTRVVAGKMHNQLPILKT